MYKVPPLPFHLDSYEGWRPSETNPKIAKISNDISPSDMWSHFVSKRRPVIIDGLLKDAEWKASKWTDLDYLRSTAGQAPVKIEPVHPAAGHFGTSVKRKKVHFAEFLDILQDPDSAGKWYLTTQYDQEGEQEPSSSAKSSTESDQDSDDSDYEPELDNVLPAPTNALSNDFPARPQLLGNLVLQQCNLWLGNSKQGKSSGLHHDFHDNLYILLSGYKRFLLFPPSAHRYLHPRGFIERVHPNGLIVYAPPGELPAYVPVPGRKQQLPIRPDGLVPSDAARWRRKARLRVKRDIDERAAADAGEGSRDKSQRKGKAKQTRAQELAEEALLQAEAELRICRMDEEGIDPEADTSEDEVDYDVDSNDDFDKLLDSLAASNGAQPGESSQDDQDSDDDDDDDDQVRKLIATLPPHMKPIGLAALAGDEDAMEKFRAYLDTAADSTGSDDQDRLSDQEEQSSRASQSDSQADHSASEDEENGLSASEDEAELGSEEQEEEDFETSMLSKPKMNSSDGFARKRKADDAASVHEDEDAQSESETVESDSSRAPAKRVKISSRVQRFSQSPASDGHSDDESQLEGSHDEEEESSDEEDGFPTFAGADSGSEFGDVDEGEAELERLLAMAQDQEDDGSASADEENEPQSFSRIPPHVLHRCLNVPDDPSCHMPKAVNGSAATRKKKVAADEPYTLMPGCPPPIEVFLKPGQMLYLPASWYHEVTSSSAPPLHNQVDPKGEGQSASKVHMALNYWFHPPDALEFEPVEPRQASTGGQGRGSNEIAVPGLGVGLGDSALEHRGAGTGTHERPYRDAEVWDEVAYAVANQIKLAKDTIASK